MMRKTIYVFATAALLTVAAGSAFAQDKTPPDTSVRALEAPADVRKKQLRSQNKPMKMHHAYHRPRHRTVSASIPRH
ncbi:hypothetical protein [Beijerinckia sp. L45]|uniref:hypothetical protein n=1 Tax=Beijerinckia sp. L45 TaxID=1641855 RepID=UPI00131D1985|nr:hypothetical protein [Beijerinckia sp. L45]